MWVFCLVLKPHLLIRPSHDQEKNPVFGKDVNASEGTVPDTVQLKKRVKLDMFARKTAD